MGMGFLLDRCDLQDRRLPKDLSPSMPRCGQLGINRAERSYTHAEEQ
jgi:hypothetical protein